MKRYAVIGPLALFAIWWLASASKIVNGFFLPGPVSTIKELFYLIGSGTILGDVGATLARVAISFGIAVIVGWPLGIVLGINRKIYKSCEFLIDFFRSTPATASFPCSF